MKGIKSSLPFRIAKRVARRVMGRTYFSRSYSQQGEDMILKTLFQSRKTGFYVDVGAHHPLRYSNTHYFYERGWRGINVEPNPDVASEFRWVRKRDINLCLGISGTPGELTYFRFREGGVNGFNFSEQRIKELDAQFTLEGRMQVMTLPLSDVLEGHLPRGTTIDFLSIDVEGMDLEVLNSNRWDRFRPMVILAEDLTAFTAEAALNSPVTSLLRGKQYHLCAKSYHTDLYVAEERLAGDGADFGNH